MQKQTSAARQSRKLSGSSLNKKLVKGHMSLETCLTTGMGQDRNRLPRICFEVPPEGVSGPEIVQTKKEHQTNWYTGASMSTDMGDVSLCQPCSEGSSGDKNTV